MTIVLRNILFVVKSWRGLGWSEKFNIDSVQMFRKMFCLHYSIGFFISHRILWAAGGGRKGNIIVYRVIYAAWKIESFYFAGITSFWLLSDGAERNFSHIDIARYLAFSSSFDGWKITVKWSRKLKNFLHERKLRCLSSSSSGKICLKCLHSLRRIMNHDERFVWFRILVWNWKFPVQSENV